MNISLISSQPPVIPNNGTIPQWAIQQLEAWEQAMDDSVGAGSPLVSMIKDLLEDYITGKKPFTSIQDVLSDIQHSILNGTNFGPYGNLDIYAYEMSQGYSAGDIATVMSILGIVAPPPQMTEIDKIMESVYSYPLPPNFKDALLDALEAELIALGSHGSLANLEEWGRTMMETDVFKEDLPNIQLFFIEMCFGTSQ